MRRHRHCDHVCCIVPFNPAHMHLFDTSVCPDCQAIRAATAKKEAQ